MKKWPIILTLLIASSLPFVAYSDNKNSQTEIWLNEYTDIHEKWESSYWFNKFPIPEKVLPLLSTCSDNGNPMCSGELGLHYYIHKKEAKTAYPYLLKYSNWLESMSKTDEIKQLPIIHIMAVRCLTEMFLDGKGVLQDFDRAIRYGKLSAHLGDAHSAYIVHLSYLRKSRRQRDDSKAFSANIMSSYAWAKVALAMDVIQQFVDPDEGQDQLEKSLTYLLIELEATNRTKSADSLAIGICSSIESCNI